MPGQEDRSPSVTHEEEEEEAEATEGEEEEEEEEEEGSDEEDESGEEDAEEDESEEGSDEERPRKKQRRTHKPFIPPPPRLMPSRTTRGNRMGKVASDEADEEFWNQDALRDEENDEVYLTESEPEDAVDADFDESEEEEESDDEEAEAAAKEPKKKVLKPPGYKKPPLPPKPKPSGAAAGSAGPKKRARPSSEPPEFVQRRAVRESTRQKVEEGEQERKLLEMLKPKRAVRQSRARATLTQGELLAEAANTEIENTRSLQVLQLIEEETRKKATADKKKYVGPMVRFLSRAQDGQELTTLEVRNMHTPPELQPCVAPPPVQQPLCVITGQPARYRDPQTKLPYANLAAFQELTRRKQLGMIAVPQAAEPIGQAAMAAAHTQRQAAQQQQQQHAELLAQQPLWYGYV